MNRRDFNAKLGKPSQFVFRGQCYDAGPGVVNRRHCAVCDRPIRLVFVLHTLAGQRVYLGSGCIEHFRLWNQSLYKKLAAARVWLRTWVTAVHHDTRCARKRVALKLSEVEYLRLKKEAAQAIREYHARTGKDWLPEELYELQCLSSKPKPKLKNPAWYTQQVAQMRRYLSAVSR